MLGIAVFTCYTLSVKTATVAPLIGTALTTGIYDPTIPIQVRLSLNLGLGWVALVLIIVACVTTNVVNLMAAGISVTNVTRKVKPLHSIWLVTVIAGFLMLIPLYLTSFLDTFMIFLEYIGGVLSALLGILVADYFVVHKMSYDMKQFDGVGWNYWYYKGVNLKVVTVWALGVFFYLGIRNVELFMNTTGTVYTTILATAILYSLIARRS